MTTEPIPIEPPPHSAVPTPIETRRPMPTIQELEELSALPDEAILKLPRDKREALLLARTKRAEGAGIDAVNAAREATAAANAAGAKADAATAATKDLQRTVADHGAKLEQLLRQGLRGGVIGAALMIILKILDLVAVYR